MTEAMTREEKRKLHSRFLQKGKSLLVKSEAALLLVLKESTVEMDSIETGSAVGEIFMTLASEPTFYALMKIAITSLDNPEGEAQYQKTKIIMTRADKKLPHD